MARLTLSSGLTRGHSSVLEHQISTTHAGQAHWANSGPFGATCGECAFLGYFRQHFNKNGDPVGASHRGGCAKFHELTGTHGPVVPKHASACRYFTRNQEQSS